MDKQLEEFVRQIHIEVRDRTGVHGPNSDARCETFTELVMEYLSENGVIENASTARFNGKIGRGVGRIDGYALNDEEDTLDLFVTIFLDSAEPAKLPSDDIRKAIEQAVRYGDAAMKGLHREIGEGSDAFAVTSRISQRSQSISIIRILVLTDGISGMSGAKIPQRDRDGVSWRFEVWDCERLSRLLQSGAPQAEIEVDLVETWGDLLPCVKVPSAIAEYSAFLTIVPGQLLFLLYDQFGPRLLERNVRSFLQAKGKVNRGIRETLKTEPHRFMAYNNGISVTAQEVETTSLGGQLAIKKIKGLQIVNGGQTTASIHRAKKTDKIDLATVFVPAKVSVLRPDLLDTLAPRIAQYANTQNPIQMADFSANDPFHIEIERLSMSIWMPGEQGKWFYERARGQYQVAQAKEGATPATLRKFKERTPPSRKFTKLDLAKYLNSWDQLPHLVSQGGQMNFVLFMQRLRETRTRTWLPDDSFYRDLIAKAILFKAATTVVRSEEFLAYRANIVTYLVAVLAFRTGGQLALKQLWDHQAPSTALEMLMRKWSHVVANTLIDSANGRNVTQWAKKVECWKAVMTADLPFPEGALPPEFHATITEHRGWGQKPREVQVALDPDEIDAIAICRATEISEWIRILDWGTSTGTLDVTQRQVVSALATLAAAGWQKDPNAKNARVGRRIIMMAHEANVG
jgi:hypothetical protein